MTTRVVEQSAKKARQLTLMASTHQGLPYVRVGEEQLPTTPYQSLRECAYSLIYHLAHDENEIPETAMPVSPTCPCTTVI